MESNIDDTQNFTPESSSDESKRKCLTISEYHAMINWIDSLINDNTNFNLNKFGWLSEKTLNEYSHLHKNTVFSIVDARVQYYVRQRHHRVFNNTSNTNSPIHSSATALNVSTSTPTHQQQRNKHLINTTNTIYGRYTELAANNSITSPLTTLANNLRMPAMLVAKIILTAQVNEERLREQLNHQQHYNNEDSLNSSILNDSTDILIDNNDSSTILMHNSETNELDTSSSIDIQLSQQLNWLTSKLLSMNKAPDEILNQSANSSVNSNSNSVSVSNKNLNLTPHQLATSTWLLRSDPQLAYEVFKCSVIDSYYGSCAEFIKSCTGKRFEQYLEQSMSSITTDAKSTNRLLYTTEKECRIRGLDMTPDMVLNEPIAIILSEDENVNYNQEYIATNYVGGSDDTIRVLNWIESKAMFGGPEQLRTVMQRQLFPYWNRYGPGAVIYWFGHILEDNEKDQSVHIGVSTNKTTIDSVSTSNANISMKNDSAEISSFNFWSKYCLLMDGFPSPDKIIMHNHRNYNRQNCLKKKTRVQ